MVPPRCATGFVSSGGYLPDTEVRFGFVDLSLAGTSRRVSAALPKDGGSVQQSEGAWAASKRQLSPLPPIHCVAEGSVTGGALPKEPGRASCRLPHFAPNMPQMRHLILRDECRVELPNFRKCLSLSTLFSDWKPSVAGARRAFNDGSRDFRSSGAQRSSPQPLISGTARSYPRRNITITAGKLLSLKQHQGEQNK